MKKYGMMLRFGKRLSAGILALLMIYSLFVPSVGFFAAAESEAEPEPGLCFRFHDLNRDGVAGVKVTLTPKEEPSDQTEADGAQDELAGQIPEAPSDEGAAEALADAQTDTEAEALPTEDPSQTKTAVSDQNGEARFEAYELEEGKTYIFSILTDNTGYEMADSAAADGEVEVAEENEAKDYLLYAALSARFEQNPVNVSYMEELSLTVLSDSLGELSYSWFKDGEPLDQTTETLTVAQMSESDQGLYTCQVRSSLAREDAFASAEVQVNMTQAEPTVQLGFVPGSGRPFTPSGVLITATVSGAGAVPTGTVTFSDGETELATVSLSDNGEASTTAVLNSGNHSIRAQYSGDDHYSEKSATSNYDIGKITAEEGTHYEVNEPTGTNGWYNHNGPMVVSVLQNAGNPFDKIRALPNGVVATGPISYEKETADGEARFVLVNSASGEESSEVTLNYKYDKTPPYNLRVPQDEMGWNRWQMRYQLNMYGEDDLSGVDHFLIVFEDGTTMNSSYYNHIYYALMGWWQFFHIQEIRCVDKAGNETLYGAVNTDYVNITYSDAVSSAPLDEEGKATADTVFYYNKDNALKVHLSAKIDGFTAEAPLLQVLVNEVEYTACVWTQSANGETWECDVGPFTDAGKYQIKVNTVDTETVHPSDVLMTTSENAEQMNWDSYVSNYHVVDNTAPVIDVVYQGNELENGATAYKTMTGVVYVTEEQTHVDPRELAFTLANDEDSFSLVDIVGNSCEASEAAKTELLNTLQTGNWTYDDENGRWCSPELSFTHDGRYQFVLSVADRSGNIGSTAEQSFVVDNTPPENLTISFEQDPVSIFLETITFGYYKDSVTVTVTAEDSYSSVAFFDWEYVCEEGASDSNVNEESGTISADDETDPEGKTSFKYADQDNLKAVASFTLPLELIDQEGTNPQYRGSIRFTATDRAGNQSEVLDSTQEPDEPEDPTEDGDTPPETTEEPVIQGFVIDNVAPERGAAFPAPSLIRDTDMAIYNGDLFARANEEETNSILYYNAAYFANTDPDQVPILLTIREANFYTEDAILRLNDTVTGMNWEQGEQDAHTSTLILANDGSYRFSLAYGYNEMDENGNMVFTYTDRSGNPMPVYHSEQIVLDRVAPKVESISFQPATAEGITETNEFVETLSYGFFFRTAFTATVHVSDAAPSSGLEQVTYRLVHYEDGKNGTVETGIARVTDGKAAIAIPAGFKGQIYAKVNDYAGNTSPEVTPRGVVIDNTPPTVEVRLNGSSNYRDAENNQLFTNTISFTATVRDTVSGIREITYHQTSENATTGVSTITVDGMYVVGASLGDGWVVTAVDHNLVTAAEKTFTYAEDDNDIVVTVGAMDNSRNTAADVNGETITVDKTAPVIEVVLNGIPFESFYYGAKRTATVTVTERNFDAGRINVKIQTPYGAVPACNFRPVSNREYTATIEFDEGDYHFEISGTDRGDHPAAVTYAGGNENRFVIDMTDPEVTTNFDTFAKEDTENSFTTATFNVKENQEKGMTVRISVDDRNFDPAKANLVILRKDAGSEHTEGGMTDVTAALLKNAAWQSSGDVHTLVFYLLDDAVYQIRISPMDQSGNRAGENKTVVFEIDKEAPVLVARSGKAVSADDVEFVDVYNSDRRNAPAPTLDFEDTNLTGVSYELTVWIPDYSNSDAIPTIRPVMRRLSAEEADNWISGGHVTLDGFTEDGVYELRLIAHDQAGNTSLETHNTYVRIADQEILAFIMDSNPSQKTGLYSFETEDGKAISMRADSFKPLRVWAVSEADQELRLILRDNEGQEIDTKAKATVDQETIRGVNVCIFDLPAEFFTDTFFNDTDTYLRLTVTDGGNRIDLGSMHIDNVAPTCVLPEELKSWHWFFGNEPREIVIRDIDETLDLSECSFYDNGEPLDVTYQEDDGIIRFELDKGWHNVGIILTDLAGNKNNIPEISNIQVGLFWLWIILAGVAVVGSGATLALVKAHKKKKAAIAELS